MCADRVKLDEPLVYRVCQYICDVEYATDGDERSCKRCPSSVQTTEGPGKFMCYSRAQEIINMVRSADRERTQQTTSPDEVGK